MLTMERGNFRQNRNCDGSSAQLDPSDLGSGDTIMKGTVGFRSFATLFNPELIKRDALMFRRIGVVV